MIRILFKGDQPSNISTNQEFEDMNHLNNWIETILSLNLLKELSLSDNEIIFITNDNYASTGEIITE